MHRSLPLLRLASTKAGMNRILRARIPIVDYIRLAVNSGTFYDIQALIRQRRRQKERLRSAGYGNTSDDDEDNERRGGGGEQQEDGENGEDEYDDQGNSMFAEDDEEDSEGDDDDDDDEEDDDDDDEEFDDEEDDMEAVQAELGLKSLVHGTSVMKYPVEYEILTQHPPVPFRPNTPRRFMVKTQPPPTRRLLEKYFRQGANKTMNLEDLAKAGEAAEAGYHPEGPRSTEEYYHRILHVSPPAPVLHQKSATMVKAYAVVQKQYELMKTEGLSEKQALAQVEEMLQEDNSTEKLQSRAVRQHVHNWRHERDTASRKSSSNFVQENPNFSKGIFSNKTMDDKELEAEQWKDSSPTILWNQPEVLFGMSTWGRRLQAVPYHKWTIGATTSLDHWIARKVLQISEESWQALLEGDASMTSRGRDLIAVRHSLFPETMMASQRRQQEQREMESMDDDSDDEEEKDRAKKRKGRGYDDGEDIRTIEELLASLGGSDFAKEYQKTQEKAAATTATNMEEDDAVDLDDGGELTDAKITRLVNELQDWRAKNVAQTFDEWSREQKLSFDMWLDRYLRWLAPGESVDRTATRMALLSSPPTTKAKSQTFWDQLKDETDAQILLDRMLKDGPPPIDATSTDYPPQISRVFWELPYEQQLQKLLDLGTLRPILEEYASETDRTKFWSKYSRIMLEDVALEHLVPDPDGPIDASSLDEATVAEFGIGPNDRFRIETVPWGQDTEGTPASRRARDLYRAWNWHKASRARYEERLYRLGKLGLLYNRDEDGNDRKY